MKNIILLLVFVTGILPSFAQLKTTSVCPGFDADILDGNVNKIYPRAPIDQVKVKFPCFSEVVETEDNGKCAGVFYPDKGIYFYTERDYIEITEKYKGKLSIPLMGMQRAKLFGLLGHPKIKDIRWDAFQMQYGTLILYYSKSGSVNKIQMSSRSTETLKLCD